jgi:hypothetical protein
MERVLVVDRGLPRSRRRRRSRLNLRAFLALFLVACAGRPSPGAHPPRRRQHRAAPGEGKQAAPKLHRAHDAPWRRGRIHLEDSASSDQSGAGRKSERDRLQLSGSASRLLPAQWAALQRGGSGACEPANKRIPASTTAVSCYAPCRRSNCALGCQFARKLATPAPRN